MLAGGIKNPAGIKVNDEMDVWLGSKWVSDELYSERTTKNVIPCGATLWWQRIISASANNIGNRS